MNILPQFLLAPYTCVHCGGIKTPCVDIEHDHPDEDPHFAWRVYLCGECAMHLARIIAPHFDSVVIGAAVVPALEERIASLIADVDSARAEADAAIASRDAVLASLPRLPAPDPVAEPAKQGRPRSGQRAAVASA